MDWLILKYAAYLKIDGLFINGLKCRFDYIKISYRIRGSESPIAITYRDSTLLLPITIAYYYCLLVRAVAH